MMAQFPRLRSPRSRAVRFVLGPVLAALLLVAVAWSFDLAASRRAVADHPAPGVLLEVAGVGVHALCAGTGEPTLVLHHGFAGGAIDWLPLIDTLAPHYRVCALDRPGNDYSPPRTQETDVPALLATLQAAQAQLGIERPVVVGHSLGGAVALSYAARYPVAGVVLLDGLSPAVADVVTARLGSYAALTPAARLGLLRPLAASFVHPGYDDDLRRQMLALRSRSSAIVAMAHEGLLARDAFDTAALRAAEAELEAPLLILAAGVSDVPEGEAFTASLRALAEQHPDSELRSVPGAGHYLLATHADEVGRAMRAWLDHNVPAGGAPAAERYACHDPAAAVCPATRLPAARSHLEPPRESGTVSVTGGR